MRRVFDQDEIHVRRDRSRCPLGTKLGEQVPLNPHSRAPKSIQSYPRRGGGGGGTSGRTNGMDSNPHPAMGSSGAGIATSRRNAPESELPKDSAAGAAPPRSLPSREPDQPRHM